MTEEESTDDPRRGAQDTGSGRIEPHSSRPVERDTTSARSSSTPDALTIIDPSSSPARTSRSKDGLDIL